MKAKEKREAEGEMVRQHHSMDMNLSKLWETVKAREAWGAAGSEAAESDTTWCLSSNLCLCKRCK